MIWGGRLISPDGIFSANVNSAPENGGAVSRHIIFMTDGKMEPSNTTQSSYGIERLDQRISGNGSASEQLKRHRARFLAVCEAVKAKGIRVWVVAFDPKGEMPSLDLTNLTTCADSGSLFFAENAQKLNEAFQDIAKEVGELRIRR
jgi:aspartate aminotransferase-like enzyme